MFDRKSFALAAAASLLLAGPAALNAKPTPPPPSETPVLRIIAASVKSLGPPLALRVCARGSVNHVGWTRPWLKPYVYVQAPLDGIYDFTFVATPPPRVAIPMRTELRAHKDWQPAPANLKGVRIHGASNSVVARLNLGRSAC